MLSILSCSKVRLAQTFTFLGNEDRDTVDSVVILIISLKELSTHFRPMVPFFSPRTHRKNKRVSAFFKGCRKGTFARNWLTTSSCFAFLFPFCFLLCFFVFCFVFMLCFFAIVSEQVSFRCQYQNVSGKSQKEEKVRLSPNYHMLFCEK